MYEGFNFSTSSPTHYCLFAQSHFNRQAGTFLILTHWIFSTLLLEQAPPSHYIGEMTVAQRGQDTYLPEVTPLGKESADWCQVCQMLPPVPSSPACPLRPFCPHSHLCRFSLPVTRCWDIQEWKQLSTLSKPSFLTWEHPLLTCDGGWEARWPGKKPAHLSVPTPPWAQSIPMWMDFEIQLQLGYSSTYWSTWDSVQPLGDFRDTPTSDSWGKFL